jgi:hypothetical protein
MNSLDESQPASNLHAFVLNLFTYVGVMVAVAVGFMGLAGLTSGAFGLQASIGLFEVAAWMMVPGAVLSALMLSWLEHGRLRPSRRAGGLAAGVVSTVSIGAITSVIAANADPGPFDNRPWVILFAIFGGITGSIAGAVAVGCAGSTEPPEKDLVETPDATSVVPVRRVPDSASSSHGRSRSGAIAGGLWLLIAGYLGVQALMLLPYMGVYVIVPAGPVALPALLGASMVTHRGGPGLPLLSVILASVLTVLGINGAVSDGTTMTTSLLTVLVGGAIVVASAFASLQDSTR